MKQFLIGLMWAVLINASGVTVYQDNVIDLEAARQEVCSAVKSTPLPLTVTVILNVHVSGGAYIPDNEHAQTLTITRCSAVGETNT